MNIRFKVKSHLWACLGTLAIHALVLLALGVNIMENEANTQLPADTDLIDLQMEDFDFENIPLEPPVSEINTSDAKSNPQQVVQGSSTQAPDETQAVAELVAEWHDVPEELKVKRIEKPMALRIDTPLISQQDTVSIAKVLMETKTTATKQAEADRKRDMYARYQFYKANYRAIYNFKKVYPYALKTRQLLEEVNEKLAGMNSESDKRKLVKETEKRLFKDYEGAIRTMSTSQGKLLLKLISRETQRTGYDLIKEYKGGFSASFWYGVGRIFGTNLKTEYHVEKEDSIIENILNKYTNNELDY